MSRALIEWGAATRALPGESDSGDRHLVKTLPDGALLAAVDGLGHGREAARAADLAVRTLESQASLPLIGIVERCHQSLLRSRGVALSLARWDARQRSLAWLGIGNVEGILLQARRDRPGPDRLLQRVGVVGVRLPVLQESTVAVPGAGLLIFATDGIGSGFDRGLDARIPPQLLADQILERHSKGTDDALVLVARLEG
ncbi:MAG: hypothetical protein AUH92_03550 [Acidobacteria bacterium 13_1_40CM_4_69_4]|nr:MAG: hypothetical protein AUH92_03550 [Acidobacteria bacterium 13_1_40CM_4_69_4]